MKCVMSSATTSRFRRIYTTDNVITVCIMDEKILTKTINGVTFKLKPYHGYGSIFYYTSTPVTVEQYYAVRGTPIPFGMKKSAFYDFRRDEIADFNCRLKKHEERIGVKIRVAQSLSIMRLFPVWNKTPVWEFESYGLTVPSSAYDGIHFSSPPSPPNNTYIASAYEAYEHARFEYEIEKMHARERYIERYYFDQKNRWKVGKSAKRNSAGLILIFTLT